MHFEALLHANFKLLDDAVEDWSTMVKNLDALAKEARTGMKASASKAVWAGANATVSKEFIGKTVGEFDDAHTQAKSIYDILRDTAGELRTYHGNLATAIQNAGTKDISVTASGNGGFTVRAKDDAKDPKPTDGDVTGVRNEIQKIVDGASESDNTATTVLKLLVNQTSMGFSDANYSDRDSAAAAVKEADELAKLAKKDPKDLSVEEFDRLNAGFKKYANDELFSERFATDVGPKKILEFWTGINDPARGNYELGHERLDQFDDLQRNLGMSLAHATQSDSSAMYDWKYKMVEMGDKPLYGDRGGPMGFQVMSNLMRTGDYDDQFMKDYGTKLMATERKLTGDGEHRNMAWQHMGMDPWLNRIGEDSGSDPLTGYLKGLSNSPDAATSFFNEEYTPKDGDKAAASNFKYLFEDREWPQESDMHGDDLNTGRNNLALALEAGTTGHPAGELPTADTPAHTADQAGLMRDLVNSISEDPNRLKDHDYMSDSIGQIGSEYLPDIHRAMADGPTVGDGDKSGWNLLYPNDGADAKLDHSAVSRFLVTASQNPEGYSALSVGEKAYTANLMDYHLNPDLPEDQRYPHDAKDTITSLSRKSGEFSGLLAQGRQEAVLGPANEKDGDFDYAVSQKKNVISGIVGTGVGIGTSFIASPVVGAAAGGAAGTVTSVVMEAFFKDDSGQYRSEAGHDIATRWETIKDTTTNVNYAAATEAAKAHHAGYSDQIDTWVSEGTATGFNDANTDIHAMAKDLDTEIPD
ncbi:hypothetical protein [Streptomyces sp. AcE210]|uniref:hypothetical protein n=1 Tax=Streptomyces sp. AcE210 TaxID=2292703 RepID=UPI000E300A0C|nr:hypothetical protein [Streptomyces sp. AcE210]RFC71968.1 hypothetical protein DXZ75_33745 [Streptomyces sp. AcE210]